MNYKQDCIYFLSDRPCFYHKKDKKIVCDTCKYYTSINKKILIIKLAALGDVVRTTSVLKPLKTKYKNSKILWITEDNAVEVLYNNPYVDEIIPYSQAYQLYNSHFDILINLDLDIRALRLTKNLFAEKKFGFFLNETDEIICSNESAEKWFKLSHNDVLKRQNKKTYQQYMMEILEFKNLSPKDYPIIINLTKEEKKFAEKFAKKFSITKNDLVIGINLGGGDKWQKKEYPVEQTVELIKLLVQSSEIRDKKVKTKNKKTGVKVLLFGGEKEEERNKKIVYLVNNPLLIDTGCKNTLREFFSLINLCDILVTSDTLALHIALALNKNVVVLFGPTSYTEIELYNLGKKIVSPIKCVVCYNRVCNKQPDCMQLMTPKQICDTILNLI
jgi:ADP-heptose:LPS heptosyltransferase